MTLPVISLLQTFPITRLVIRLQLNRAGPLPGFKGSLYHGLLGHGLKAVDSKAFHILYHQHENGQPKPYSVLPKDDLREYYNEGEILCFEVRLFGQATQLADLVIEALQYARGSGLGPMRLPYTLISVSSELGGREAAGIHSVPLLDFLAPELLDMAADSSEREIAIELKTPLRIKYNNQLLKCGPGLPLLVNNVARRLHLLSRYWWDEDKNTEASIYASLPRLAPKKTDSYCYFENWLRYSRKEKSFGQFGGVKGLCSYFGTISPALPWLAIGEQLQLGGKTTFGLGEIKLIA